MSPSHHTHSHNTHISPFPSHQPHPTQPTCDSTTNSSPSIQSAVTTCPVVAPMPHASMGSRPSIRNTPSISPFRTSLSSGGGLRVGDACAQAWGRKGDGWRRRLVRRRGEDGAEGEVVELSGWKS